MNFNAPWFFALGKNTHLILPVESSRKNVTNLRLSSPSLGFFGVYSITLTSDIMP